MFLLFITCAIIRRVRCRHKPLFIRCLHRFEWIFYATVKSGLRAFRLYSLLGVFHVAVALIADQVKESTDPGGYLMDQYRSEPGSAMTLIGMLIGPMLGIIPLLMYGQYVALAIQQLNLTVLPNNRLQGPIGCLVRP